MKTKAKALLLSSVSVIAMNAPFAPVLAEELLNSGKQEAQTEQAQVTPAISEGEPVFLIPQGEDLPEGMSALGQAIPVKAYIALRGENSLEGKEIIELVPEVATGNKDLSKEGNELSEATESEYFVVLPEGEALSDEELAQVEGEVAWFVPGLIGGVSGGAMTFARCGWSCSASDYAWGVGSGAVAGYAPGGLLGRAAFGWSIRQFRPIGVR